MYTNNTINDILTWDYDATGDLAPWDYDENTVMGSGRLDAQAFVEEYGWDVPAKDNPAGFTAAFTAWYAAAQASK